MAVRFFKRDNAALAGLLAITALVFSRTLGHYPVADDWVMLEPRSFLSTAGYFLHSVIPPEFNALWFRPLPMFTFWLDNVLWPGTFWGPHLFNLLFHLANIVLLWSLIGMVNNPATARTSSERPLFPAFAACLLYALHPLVTEPVAWIAARFDLMAVTFGLAALILWFRRERSPEKKSLFIWCILFLAGALLSKEQGIVFPATVAVLCLYALYTTRNIGRYLPPALAIAALGLVYLTYRFVLFHGLGGYLQTEQGISLRTPFAYFLAILFPYPNLVPGWQVTVFLIAVLLLFVLFMAFLLKIPYRKARDPDPAYLLAAALVFLFGLATTAPHVSMKIWDIMGHDESRFALIAVAGAAFGAGVVLMLLVRSARAQRIVLLILGIWGAVSLWRIDVQVAAWHASSETARTIVETTVREVPRPNPQSVFYFFDIPSFSPQFTYIFGIGLREAILRRYPGRTDLTIIRQTKSEDLGKARPGVDYVFWYHKDKGLERLYPQVRTSPQ